MKSLKTTITGILFGLTGTFTSVFGCTDLCFIANDHSALIARSMEFAVDLKNHKQLSLDINRN